jgi:hypothetical protein
MSRTWNRLLWSGVVLFILLAACIGGFLALLPEDEPLADDSFLRRPTVVVAENAFDDYKEAAEKVVWTEVVCEARRKQFAGEPWDTNAVRLVLADNEECFAAIRRGNRNERCIVPTVTNIAYSAEYISGWLKAAKLMELKVTVDMADGAGQDAVETLGDMLRFALLCEQDGGMLIDYLVAIAVRSVALTKLRVLVLNDRFDDALLVKLNTILLATVPTDRGFVCAMRAEYIVSVNAVDQIVSGSGDAEYLTEDLYAPLSNLWIKLFFRPNRTKNAFNELYSGLIRQAANPYTKKEAGFVDDFLSEHPDPFCDSWRIANLTMPNPLGNCLLHYSVPGLGGVDSKRLNIKVDHRAALLLVALRRYRNKYGNYPAKLAELVPEFMDKVPVDPYDGAPMRYSAKKLIVYSVGEDLLDSGGSKIMLPGKREYHALRDRWQREDVVFAVEKKEDDKNKLEEE